MLTGKLLKHNGIWCVIFTDRKPNTEVEWYERVIPLHPDDQKEFSEMEIVFDNLESRATNQPVTIELIDEFTHPHMFENVGWGDGSTCAKIIKL